MKKNDNIIYGYDDCFDGKFTTKYTPKKKHTVISIKNRNDVAHKTKCNKGRVS